MSFKQKKFIADISQTVYDGQLCYNITYTFYNVYKIFGKTFEIRQCHKQQSDFYFKTIDDAEKYVNNIEWPESHHKQYIHAYYIYPKDAHVLKKYGYFYCWGYELLCDLSTIAMHSQFRFYDCDIYGNSYALPINFSDNTYNTINDIIDTRHLKDTSKLYKRISVEYKELPVVQLDKASKDIEELKKVVSDYRQCQEDNNNFLKKLLK